MERDTEMGRTMKKIETKENVREIDATNFYVIWPLQNHHKYFHTGSEMLMGYDYRLISGPCSSHVEANIQGGREGGFTGSRK